MKQLVLFVALTLTGLLTACGHNAITFGKGVGFEAGFDPEHMTGRVELLYGEMLNIAARDNFEIVLKTDVEGGQETSSATAKTGTELRVKFGQQINGYTVDAIKAGADAKDLVRPVPEEAAEPAPEEGSKQAPPDDGE